MAARLEQNRITTVLYWARDDLRTRDNPALSTAAKADNAVVALYILEEGDLGSRPLGGASRWWLDKSLRSFQAELRAIGIPLILRRGDPRKIVPAVVAELAAKGVYWNRRYSPTAQQIDRDVKADLKKAGMDAQSFNGCLLAEPWDVQTGTGGPYKVFSPFSRALRSQIQALSAIPAPGKARPSRAANIPSDDLDSWTLTPTSPNWAAPFGTIWSPGEAGALRALERFCDEGLEHYASGRDYPSKPAVSRLSPHLRFGEISPRQAILAAMSAAEKRDAGTLKHAEKFTSELAWREFSYHLLYHFPDFPSKSWRPEFDAFPWLDDQMGLDAWTRGKTGYPFVDAGMRELWATGYMHNRVRMIVASFLCKHLLIDWRRGEEWFWDTLLDADLANNTVSWQWVAGSGADAAPYFRIFNPIIQGERFDPDGAYVRQWVPELSALPNKYIHAPWTTPTAILKSADVTLGGNYPQPIVDHSMARTRALDAYKTITNEKAARGTN